MNENNNILLTCEADGRPKAEITWYRGAVQLLHDGTKYSIQDSQVSVLNGISRTRSELTVLKVNRVEAGTYTCKAQNVVNIAESSTQLVVRCKYIQPV